MDHTLSADRVLALRRAGTLGVAKIAYRGWQEASRWLDLIAPPEAAVFAEPALVRHAPVLADPAAALHVLRTAAPRRFFDRVEPRTAALVRERFPEHCRAVIEAAEILTRPCPWESAGARGAATSDPAIGHDPSRHHWLLRLAQAYALSGDARYAEACVAAIDAWLDDAPASLDHDFAHSPEFGFRLMSWSWALVLLRESPDV